jgi:hypothetical protein
VSYSFRLAYESGAFLQRDLITQEKLRDEARKRGIIVPAFAEYVDPFFEQLDELGLFCPIAFTTEGPYVQSSYHEILGRPELSFREENEFRPWYEYCWNEEDGEGGSNV